MKIFFLQIFIFSSILLAQTSKDSLLFSSSNFAEKYFLNSFQKQLNSNNYSISLKQFYKMDKLFFGVKEQFNSTIVSTNTKNIKDEHFLSAITKYSFSDQFKFGTHINNSIYSDDRNIGLNKASLLTASLFADYSPYDKITINPFVGFEQNNQVDEKDNGIVYGLESSTDDFNFGDFELNTIIKYRDENISPRKNTLRLLNFDLQNKFEDNFYNTITINYLQQRRDYYFSADKFTAEEFNIINNIQSRIETNYNLQDRISLLQSESPFSFDLYGRISVRNIDRATRFISTNNLANVNYDTKINEMRLEFSSVTEYKKADYNFSARFSFSERDEKHQPIKYEGISNIIFDERKSLEEQKNNSSQLVNITVTGSIFLSTKDLINFSLFHRKLKYDTPSQINFDDRDELLSIGNIYYEHSFHPFFKAFGNIEASINKMVYIFAARSANNNIKRTIKFSSGGTFSNNVFVSKNSAEVSANYTVFDYEELNPNFKSYSFRQFAFRDSSNFSITKILGVNLISYLKLSEQGNFSWNNFSESPQRYLQEEFFEPKIFYKYSELIFKLGIRFYSLKTFSFKAAKEKILLSEYKSIGPISEIDLVITGKINLKLLGGYEFIKDEANKNRQMANLDFRITYNF